MKSFLLSAIAAAAIAVPTAAHAQAAWDSRGWVMLGERTVNGSVDHDRIDVGSLEGTFSKLTVVVENSDLEMIDFKIEFADRTNYHPTVNQVFREGTRTRVIDLPPGEHVIKYLNFKYRNLPGGGNAKVAVWAWKTGGGVVPPPTPAPVFDSRGWVNLGERTVNGRVDRDRIDVGIAEGKFSKLTVVVENSDLEMIDFKVEFADHTNYRPTVNQVFREGTRTRVIDMPPGEHVIKYIEFKYKNLPGGGNAKVSVWAWKTGNATPTPPIATGPVWDSNGWTMLGEREVNGHGREDHDRIEVGRYEGRFTKLTVVVLNSDLEMIDMEVKFGRGAPWHPSVNQFFREGTRTRVIDFPGDERTIRFIDFKYRNLPGGGRAKVQVWAKAEAAARPAFRFESKGWEMLGERVVNGHGREDIDKIEVGRAMGKFSRVTVVVLDSDLEMIDLSIKFKRGEPFHPAVNMFFREDTRTKVIDLPGDRDRTIEWIEFKYRNLPGGGHAKVQVWAQ